MFSGFSAIIFTNALPTIVPSGPVRIISLTWSGLEIVNPAARGKLPRLQYHIIFRHRFRSSIISVHSRSLKKCATCSSRTNSSCRLLAILAS